MKPASEISAWFGTYTDLSYNELRDRIARALDATREEGMNRVATCKLNHWDDGRRAGIEEALALADLALEIEETATANGAGSLTTPLGIRDVRDRIRALLNDAQGEK